MTSPWRPKSSARFSHKRHKRNKDKLVRPALPFRGVFCPFLCVFCCFLWLKKKRRAGRMTKLNAILEENCRKWPEMPVTVTISHGVAGFDSLTQLGHAIELADQAMYAARNELRGALVSKAKLFQDVDRNT